MKVALAQINPTVGDFPGNTEKILHAAEEALRLGAQLAVFSELCLCGYPPRDLLEKAAFLEAQDRALDRLKHKLKPLPTILGYITRRYDGAGNRVYNSCGFLVDGEVRAVGRKCLLPAYDVFDEDRHFEAGEGPTCVEWNGIPWGLTICEDVWNDKDFWQRRVYPRDPVEELVAQGAKVIINLSASPYHLGKQTLKEAMLSSLARKHRRPLLYVNQAGGNDELLFDGRSLALNSQGKLLARAPAFQSAVVLVDLANEVGTVAPRIHEEEELRQALVMGLRDYVSKCGFNGAVLGLSGGIDSALVAALAAEALGPESVTAVAMPSRFNAPEGLADARELAERLGLEFHVVPIEKPLGAVRELLAPVFAGRPEDVTEENLQARLRGLLLMAFSNKFGHLLLSTGNKSELATGYCTLYGDMCGGLAVIADLYKTTVYRLARYLNAQAGRPLVPERCLTRPPSAELKPGQTDQDTLPSYEVLDAILKGYIEEQRSAEQIVTLGYDLATVRRVIRMVDYSEYKRRQAAPGLRVTSKAFGLGRRIPIAQRFREGE